MWQDFLGIPDSYQIYGPALRFTNIAAQLSSGRTERRMKRMMESSYCSTHLAPRLSEVV